MKKTIKFFAMLALVSAVAFVACSKDDEENSSVSSAIQVTFGDEVVPLGWHNFTYDGQYFDIEAAQRDAPLCGRDFHRRRYLRRILLGEQRVHL